MTTLIVMDKSGDTRHEFDSADARQLLEAEARFRELTGAGFTAATRNSTGEARLTRMFDPTANEILFFPNLVGG
jgi:hypothetical protein